MGMERQFMGKGRGRVAGCTRVRASKLAYSRANWQSASQSAVACCWARIHAARPSVFARVARALRSAVQVGLVVVHPTERMSRLMSIQRIPKQYSLP